MDTVTFTLWKLCRLINDSEWCILCLKGHGTQKPSVKALSKTNSIERLICLAVLPKKIAVDKHQSVRTQLHKNVENDPFGEFC